MMAPSKAKTNPAEQNVIIAPLTWERGGIRLSLVRGEVNARDYLR